MWAFPCPLSLVLPFGDYSLLTLACCIWEFVLGSVQDAALCCTDCREGPPTGMSMVLKVCTIWRCSSHSLAEFLLRLYVPFNLGWLVLDFKLTVGFASSVHCHIFGFDASLLCLFYCFGSAPTLLVQVYWVSSIALWVPTLNVNSYTTYRKTDGSIRWYANRLVLCTMVREPSRFGLICPFWLDLPCLDCLCLSYILCMFCVALFGG